MDADHVQCFSAYNYFIHNCSDSKHRAITQTTHMNLISWVCSVTQITLGAPNTLNSFKMCEFPLIFRFALII